MTFLVPGKSICDASLTDNQVNVQWTEMKHKSFFLAGLFKSWLTYSGLSKNSEAISSFTK